MGGSATGVLITDNCRGPCGDTSLNYAGRGLVPSPS